MFKSLNVKFITWQNVEKIICEKIIIFQQHKFCKKVKEDDIDETRDVFLIIGDNISHSCNP